MESSSTPKERLLASGVARDDGLSRELQLLLPIMSLAQLARSCLLAISLVHRMRRLGIGDFGGPVESGFVYDTRSG